MTRPTVAVIGYSEFSKLIIRHLSQYANVVLASRRPKVDKAGLNFEQVDLRTALAQ
jgi:glutamyl-tRNA reductase